MRKKLTASVFAAAAALAVTAQTAFAAVSFTAGEFESLSSFLLGAPGAVSTDVNGDGVCDTFDLVFLRRGAQSTGEFTEQTIPATEKNTKYTGRVLWKNDTAWLIHSGCATEFTVTGKSASVNITGDGSENNSSNSKPRYAVIVDGEIILDELLSVKDKTVELFSGETSRTATVKVIHLSEANNGAIGVRGITVNSDRPAPVTPLPKKDLTIEFIGDSITCAYGVEGKDQYEGFKTATENFMKSYAYLTAELLDADYSAVCFSGYGTTSGYTSSGTKNATSLVPPLYDSYGSSMTALQAEWDHSAHPVDAVFINLGTNDSGYVTKAADTRSAEYISDYAAFLRDVRADNPDAPIICTVGVMGCAEMYPYIEEAVKTAKEKYQVENVFTYLSPTHDYTNDGIGSDWHPSVITQQKNAALAASEICRALGIEYNDMSLNVAKDGTFRTVTDESANMSEYLNDWDKSYHVTTVAGGSSQDSIVTTLSPVRLKKDATYRISFSASANAGTEIPLKLASADGKEYFSDTLTGTGDKAPFSAEFTVTEADPAAVLSFMLGGTDSLRFSIYNMEITRIR